LSVVRLCLGIKLCADLIWWCRKYELVPRGSVSRSYFRLLFTFVRGTPGRVSFVRFWLQLSNLTLNHALADTPLGERLFLVLCVMLKHQYSCRIPVATEVTEVLIAALG